MPPPNTTTPTPIATFFHAFICDSLFYLIRGLCPSDCPSPVNTNRQGQKFLTSPLARRKDARPNREVGLERRPLASQNTDCPQPIRFMYFTLYSAPGAFPCKQMLITTFDSVNSSNVSDG